MHFSASPLASSSVGKSAAKSFGTFLHPAEPESARPPDTVLHGHSIASASASHYLLEGVLLDYSTFSSLGGLEVKLVSIFFYPISDTGQTRPGLRPNSQRDGSKGAHSMPYGYCECGALAAGRCACLTTAGPARTRTQEGNGRRHQDHQPHLFHPSFDAGLFCFPAFHCISNPLLQGILLGDLSSCKQRLRLCTENRGPSSALFKTLR